MCRSQKMSCCRFERFSSKYNETSIVQAFYGLKRTALQHSHKKTTTQRTRIPFLLLLWRKINSIYTYFRLLIQTNLAYVPRFDKKTTKMNARTKYNKAKSNNSTRWMHQCVKLVFYFLLCYFHFGLKFSVGCSAHFPNLIRTKHEQRQPIETHTREKKNLIWLRML